jgi:hypothetical protein
VVRMVGVSGVIQDLERTLDHPRICITAEVAFKVTI